MRDNPLRGTGAKERTAKRRFTESAARRRKENAETARREAPRGPMRFACQDGLRAFRRAVPLAFFGEGIWKSSDAETRRENDGACPHEFLSRRRGAHLVIAGRASAVLIEKPAASSRPHGEERASRTMATHPSGRPLRGLLKMRRVKSRHKSSGACPQ